MNSPRAWWQIPLEVSAELETKMLLAQASPPQSAESGATEEGVYADARWQESLRLTQDSMLFTKSTRSSGNQANLTPVDRFTPVLNQWIPRASDQARLQTLAKPTAQKKAKLRLEDWSCEPGFGRHSNFRS
ncbi:unnamed protein product [Symbiodinium sp. CCMP2592]|nr:unnamed protein product [Symbiodinium sp. CCMP2592]